MTEFDANLKAAEKFIEVKRYDEAEAKAKNCLSLSKTDPRGYVCAAKAAYLQNSVDRALKYLQLGISRSCEPENMRQLTQMILAQRKDILTNFEGVFNKTDESDVKLDFANEPLETPPAPVAPKKVERPKVATPVPPPAPSKKTTKVVLSPQGVSKFTALREGSEALNLGHFKMALDCFAKALDIAKDLPVEEKPERARKYAISLAHIGVGTYKSLVTAVEMLRELKGRTFPAAFYGLCLALEKLNRFKTGVAVANEGLGLLSRLELDLEQYSWPGQTVPIEETKREVLVKKLKTKISFYNNPPKPDAICRLPECHAQSTHFIPSEMIYNSDLDFSGYITMFCEENCKISFHVMCWKVFKEHISEVVKVSDKDILGTKCPTDGCRTGVVNPRDSIIIRIRIIDANQEVKTELERERSVDPPALTPAASPIKKAKKRPAVPGQKGPAKPTRKPSKLARPHGAKEEEGIAANTCKVYDSPEAKLKELELCRTKTNFGRTCYNIYDPRLSFFGHPELKEQRSYLELCEENDSQTVQEQKRKVLQYYLSLMDFLKGDPLMKTQVVKNMKDLGFCKSIAFFMAEEAAAPSSLLRCLRFASIDDRMCFSEHVDKLYEQIRVDLVSGTQHMARLSLPGSQPHAAQRARDGPRDSPDPLVFPGRKDSSCGSDGVRSLFDITPFGESDTCGAVKMPTAGEATFNSDSNCVVSGSSGNVNKNPSEGEVLRISENTDSDDPANFVWEYYKDDLENPDFMNPFPVDETKSVESGSLYGDDSESSSRPEQGIEGTEPSAATDVTEEASLHAPEPSASSSASQSTSGSDPPAPADSEAHEYEAIEGGDLLFESDDELCSPEPDEEAKLPLETCEEVEAKLLGSLQAVQLADSAAETTDASRPSFPFNYLEDSNHLNPAAESFYPEPAEQAGELEHPVGETEKEQLQLKNKVVLLQVQKDALVDQLQESLRLLQEEREARGRLESRIEDQARRHSEAQEALLARTSEETHSRIKQFEQQIAQMHKNAETHKELLGQAQREADQLRATVASLEKTCQQVAPLESQLVAAQRRVLQLLENQWTVLAQTRNGVLSREIDLMFSAIRHLSDVTKPTGRDVNGCILACEEQIAAVADMGLKFKEKLAAHRNVLKSGKVLEKKIYSLDVPKLPELPQFLLTEMLQQDLMNDGNIFGKSKSCCSVSTQTIQTRAVEMIPGSQQAMPAKPVLSAAATSRAASSSNLGASSLADHQLPKPSASAPPPVVPKLEAIASGKLTQRMVAAGPSAVFRSASPATSSRGSSPRSIPPGSPAPAPSVVPVRPIPLDTRTSFPASQRSQPVPLAAAIVKGTQPPMFAPPPAASKPKSVKSNSYQQVINEIVQKNPIHKTEEVAEAMMLVRQRNGGKLTGLARDEIMRRVYDVLLENMMQGRTTGAARPTEDTPARTMMLERCQREECVICYDVLGSTDIFRLPCQHIFHQKCLSSWLNTSGGSKVCPVCRRELLQTRNAPNDQFPPLPDFPPLY